MHCAAGTCPRFPFLLFGCLLRRKNRAGILPRGRSHAIHASDGFTARFGKREIRLVSHDDLFIFGEIDLRLCFSSFSSLIGMSLSIAKKMT